MAFGFIGDIVEQIGETILPRGTRGATIGGALGGTAGAALGARLTADIATGSRGQEAVSSQTPKQAASLAPESALSSVGPNVYRPTFADYEGMYPISASIGTAVGAVGKVIRRPEVASTIGAVGGALMDNVLDFRFGADPCADKMKKLVGMRRDCNSGAMCPTVTRKQQNTLRKMLEYLPIEEVAYQAGVDVSTLARLVAKSMPARKRGISGSQLSTAKRVNNQILNMAGKLGYNVTPKTKAQLGCK